MISVPAPGMLVEIARVGKDPRRFVGVEVCVFLIVNKMLPAVAVRLGRWVRV